MNVNPDNHFSDGESGVTRKRIRVLQTFPEMKGNVESKALYLHDNITVLGPQSSQLLCDWRVDSIRRGLMEKKKIEEQSIVSS